MIRSASIAVLGALFITACGSSSGPDAERDNASERSVTESSNALAGERTEDRDDPLVQREDQNGVSYYWHENNDHDDALLTGTPTIADGCLRVGSSVVIWHESKVREAQGIIEALLNGDVIGEVTIGGGEGTSAVSEANGIAERCSGAPIWFGSP